MSRPLKEPSPWGVASTWPPTLLLLGLLSLGGCPAEGKLDIQLEVPAGAPELNPMDDERLASFTLQMTDLAGQVLALTSAPFDPTVSSLTLGELPTGVSGKLTLTGFSGSNQVLAYGEAGPFTVAQGQQKTVLLPLRKPLTYLAGAGDLQAFDTSRSHAEDNLAPITVGQPGQLVTAVASTPDGRWVLVTVADDAVAPPPTPQAPSLLLLNTLWHTETRSVPLETHPDELAVSPDGRWAVISSTDASRVTVVDIDRLVAGDSPESATSWLNLYAPRRAVFTDTADGMRAVVLRDPMLVNATCTPPPAPSQVSVINLESASLLSTVVLSSAARDLAARPGDTRVFVAQPCLDRVAVFDVHDDSETNLVGLTGARSLLVQGSRLLVGLSDVAGDGGRARVAVSAIDLPTLGLSHPVQTAFPADGYLVKPDDSGSGALVLRAEPREVYVYNLSAPPGGTRLGALVLAIHYADFRSAPITLVTPNIEELEIWSFSYLGLDLITGQVHRRYRAVCWTHLNRNFGDFYECDNLLAHEAPPVGAEFLPRGTSSLYGVR